MAYTFQGCSVEEVNNSTNIRLAHRTMLITSIGSSTDYGGYTINFMDTDEETTHFAGRDFALHPMIYFNPAGSPDVVVICFSIFDRESYDNALEKWAVEGRKGLGMLPVYLVGLHADETVMTFASGPSEESLLSEDKQNSADKHSLIGAAPLARQVSEQEARQLAMVKGFTYVEGSAITGGQEIDGLISTVSRSSLLGRLVDMFMGY